MFMKKQYTFFALLLFGVIFLEKPLYSAIKIPNLEKNILPGIVLVIGADGENYTMGTGFFVTTKGDVLTSYNVIKDKPDILLNIIYKDKLESYNAKLRGYDESRDLALLMTKLPKEKFKVLSISNQTLKQGKSIAIVGLPEVVKESTVGPQFVSPGGSLSFPQINTPLTWTDIGSPIIDVKGNVVGLATKRYLQQGGVIDLAVPSPLLVSFVNYAKNLPPVDIFPKKTEKQIIEQPLKTEVRSQTKTYGRFIPVYSGEDYGSVYLDRDSFSSYRGICSVLIQVFPSNSTRRKLQIGSDMSHMVVQYDVDIDYNSPKVRVVQGVGVFTNGETVAITDFDTRWISSGNSMMFQKMVEICRGLF